MYMLNVLGITCLSLMTVQGVLSESDSQSCPLDNDFDESYIGITLSPTPGAREVKILWNNRKFHAGDEIRLLKYELRDGFTEIYSFLPISPSGVDNTGLIYNLESGTPSYFMKRCLLYYVVWVRGGWIRQINCLGTEPTWINDRIELIGELTLRQLFIPGTHHSGSYEVDSTYGIFTKILEPYAITQDLNVLDQLIYGARYLDIRISHYSDDDTATWWVNNLAIRSTPLENVIDQVKVFLNHTNEIVIFDVQGFPIGFKNRETYLELVNHLMKEFEDYLIPSTHNWDTKLSEIYYNTKKRLILTFNRSVMPVWFSQIWPSIRQKSSDSSELSDLFTHLESVERPQYPDNTLAPKAALAELALKIDRAPKESNTFGPSPDLRDTVDTQVTLWYHLYWSDVANIVAVDFITSSGIVAIAIKSNEIRSNNYKSFVRSESCFSVNESWIPSVQSMMNSRSVEHLVVPFVEEHAVQRMYSIIAHNLL